MTPQQKIALATQIRAGHADAIFKVTHGPVSIEEQAERRHFFANADVQRKLVKGWIHGTMTEPAIIEAMKETGVVLTEDAGDKIWHAKSALMLDTFQNRPETLSVLPLLKNLSVERKREIANTCVERYQDFAQLSARSARQYYKSVWKNDGFQKLAADLIAALDSHDDLRTELIACTGTYHNAKNLKEVEVPLTLSTSLTSLTVPTSNASRHVHFEQVVSATPTTNIFTDSVKGLTTSNIPVPSIRSAINFSGLGAVALQLLVYASNQNRLVGAMDGLMITNSFLSPLSMFAFQDFQYGSDVTPFNVSNVNNTKSDFQYISFDELDIGEDEFDVPKPEIDVLEYQFASYNAFLNFGANNASQPVSYISFGDVGDYGWSTAATGMNDDAEYADMPALVPYEPERNVE